MFPSPGGVWVVSFRRFRGLRCEAVSVPWRGVGCVKKAFFNTDGNFVSVPWRGVGCVLKQALWLSLNRTKFPSPGGVWVVSAWILRQRLSRGVSVPWRGVGCVCFTGMASTVWASFRPLAGCGLCQQKHTKRMKCCCVGLQKVIGLFFIISPISPGLQ